MLKFTVGCDFGGVKSNVTLYVGDPEGSHHPLHFQNTWLSKERGGTIPDEVMKNLEKLLKISRENGVPFEDLCKYAIESANLAAQRNQELSDNSKRASEVAENNGRAMDKV